MNAAPDPAPSPLAVSIELGFVVAGLVLLWSHVLGARARAQRLPPALAPWPISGSDFLLYLAFGFCSGLVCQIAAARLTANSGLPFETRLIFANAGLHLGVLAGLAAFHLAFARQDLALPATPCRTFRDGAATVLIALPLVAVVTLAWQALLGACGVPIERQSVVDLFIQAHSLVLRVTLTVFAVIVAPVTEELIFRRGLFRFLRGRAPRWVALTFPAVLFGAAHANLASFAPLVALGVVFSLAYERTGRIGTSMVAHGLFNLNMVVLIFAGVNV